MNRMLVVRAFLLLVVSWPTMASAETLSGWVQHTTTGREARVVTDAPSCPSLTLSGRTVRMVERAAPSASFPHRVCAAAVPSGAKDIAVDGITLPSGIAEPIRIVVVGDTGCRLSADAHQACNDPEQWPWSRVAARAAAMRPDLVIHVGDYYYREVPCPAGVACEGPHGDNWASWDADFFAPAKPLLAAAPWVMVRGNHEECARGGDGWTRMLAPIARTATCIEHEPLYTVPIYGTTLAVLDSAVARDLRVESVGLYRNDFASLAQIARGPTWLLSHHPLRGIVRINPDGRVVGGNRTLLAAHDELPDAVQLLLSGHIHVFQVLNYTDGPPQIIAGHGGDNLDRRVPPQLAGLRVGDLDVRDGVSVGGFGFVLLELGTAGSWQVRAYNLEGTRVQECLRYGRRIRCAPP